MSLTISGRDTRTLLEYEAKRRPVLAKLLERVAFLSDEEIEGADLPLSWMRIALRRQRDEAAYQRRLREAEITMQADVIQGTTPDPVGTICEYVGGDFFMKARTLIEVRTGTLVFLPESGGLWLDHSFYAERDPALLAALRPVEHGKRDRYFDMRRERLLRLHGDAPVIDLTGERQGGGPVQSEAVSRLGALGVRIGR